MVNINKLNGGNITVTLGSSGNTYPRWIAPIYSNEFIPDDTQFGIFKIGSNLTIENGHVYEPGTSTSSYETLTSFDGVTILHMYPYGRVDGGSDPQFTLYRRYIPGHWEDENGNWVNGYWSNTNDGIWTGNQDTEAKLCETQEDLETTSFTLNDIEAWGASLPVWIAGNNLLEDPDHVGKGLNVSYSTYSGELFLRTWTNTVQPPQ